jgi:hypothetical protein
MVAEAGCEAINAQVIEGEELALEGTCCFEEFPTEEVGRLVVFIILVEILVLEDVVVVMGVLGLVGGVVVLVRGAKERVGLHN